MKFYGRSVVAMVLLFTAAAVAMLWGLNQRSRAELSEQVIARAQQRSMQLADAMAGQVAAELALMDHTLLGAREAWLTDPAAVPALTARRLKSLPDALVTYVSLVNADGVVTFNSAGVGIGLDVSDRSHFAELKTGADRMVIGDPVKARIDGAWLIPVGRPLYRGGQFAGAMYLLVSSERLAQKLGRLALADDDIVALVKHDGQFLAHSLNNEGAMGKTLPENRPFLHEGAADVGSLSRNRNGGPVAPRVRLASPGQNRCGFGGRAGGVVGAGAVGAGHEALDVDCRRIVIAVAERAVWRWPGCSGATGAAPRPCARTSGISKRRSAWPRWPT